MEIRIPYKPRTYQLEVHNILENGKRFSIIVAHRGFGKTVLSVNHLIKQALLVQDGTFGYVAPIEDKPRK
jgi:superfamily II RNA helicase